MCTCFKFVLPAVESRTELVRLRQDVPVGCDLMPHAASMSVTCVVDPCRILAEESARLPSPNPASDNLTRKCRCVGRGLTAQKSYGASAAVFAQESRVETSL